MIIVQYNTPKPSLRPPGLHGALSPEKELRVNPGGFENLGFLKACSRSQIVGTSLPS